MKAKIDLSEEYKRLRRVKSALSQLEEGAMTYPDFVVFCLNLIRQYDVEEYKRYTGRDWDVMLRS